MIGLPCPLCQFYDELVNDCVNPCFEYGASSSYCQRFGCPATVDTTTSVQTWQLPATAAALSGNGNTTVFIVVIVIVIIFIVLGTLIFRRYQKRRRLAVSNEGKTPHVYFKMLFFVF